MKMYMRIEDETIVEFYDRIAAQLGYTNINDLSYDCTKLTVSVKRSTAIMKRYPKESAAMIWVCYGPKAIETLADEEIVLEDGFITEV